MIVAMNGQPEYIIRMLFKSIADCLPHHYGIETLECKRGSYLYLNKGDTYDQTLVVNLKSGRSYITYWGYFVNA